MNSAVDHRAHAVARMSNIDALRAISALLVVLAHSVEMTKILAKSPTIVDLALRWICSHIDLGRVGVIAFFCISGFLIPATLTGTGVHSAAGFMIKRLMRIYPPFWFSIVLIAVVLALGPGMPAIQQMLVTATMIPVLLGGEAIMGHYWTLELELIFYMLCAGLFLCRIGLGPMSNIIIAYGFTLAGLAPGRIGAMATTLLGAGIPNPLELPFTRMFLLALGVMFWAAALRSMKDGFQLGPAVTYAVKGFAAAYVVAVPLYGLAIHLIVGDTPRAAAIIGNGLGLTLFLASLHWQRGSRALSNLGLSSYSLYLLHPAALYLLPVAFTRWPAAGEFAIAGPFAIVFVMATAILLAKASYIAVELPSQRLGRTLASRYALRAEPRPSSL